jgi:pimeloyl-ACP methyl ester carboxylesterase
MLVKKPQDQYIEASNIKTRFWTLGNKGTTVLLIHGLGGSVERWIYNINSLAQYHRVYVMDLPGFGLAEKIRVPLTFSHGAQFIKDFMQVQGIDNASLIGHSMGGAITLQFALKFPDKVERLVLVDSAGLGKELALILRLISLPYVGEYFTRRGRKETVRPLLTRCVYNPTVITDELVEYTYQHTIRPGANKCFLSTLRWISNLRGQRADNVNSLVKNLTSIVAPTLVLWGKQDRMIPVAHAYVAKRGIPNAELCILDSCGHLPQLEHVEDFNNLVLEFLSIL